MTDPRQDEWRDRAACRDTNPERWVHKKGQHIRTETWAWHRSICAACPVLEQCAAWTTQGDRLGYGYAFAAGLSPDERRLHHRWCQCGCGLAVLPPKTKFATTECLRTATAERLRHTPRKRAA